jgi:hypothetical protein
MLGATSRHPVDARGLAARVPDGPLAIAAAVAGAAALLVAAAVHLAQLVSNFHAVPWIGPLFAADAVASTAIAIAILATRRRIAAACGALVSAGALLGLALASTTGLLGWQKAVLRPAVVIAIASELLALATLAPLALTAPLRPSTAIAPRAVAAAGLVAVAALHRAAAGDEWTDARAVFWLFIALAAACLALALRLAQGLDGWTWAAVLALAASPLAGYLVSRTTGLPRDPSDIGDWADPLGLASLAVEAAVVSLALARLRIAFATTGDARPAAVASTQQAAPARPPRNPRPKRTLV